jgi:maltooligosyltrehalose trehalohydrolase
MQHLKDTENFLQPDSHSYSRRLPIGAEIQREGGVHFRVWAPDWKEVAIVLQTGAVDEKVPAQTFISLDNEEAGYFSIYVPHATQGMKYSFRLGNNEFLYPDPASRFQPEGPMGPSEIIDPADFTWTDRNWQGVSLEGQIIYEMHIGTFTQQGSWEAAGEELPTLKETGITLLEIMPLAEFAGEFGWGYDGVDLFAPTRLYGRPNDFRSFVDRAHALGIGVILDVVYNHFGPTGNWAPLFAKAYNSQKHKTDWGEAMNYDGENAGSVREFVISNAGYWIDEFHLDGLRIDAVQAIVDDSSEHILAAIAKQVRRSARERKTLVVVENELQDAKLVRSYAEGGYGLDAVWNDDFHHAARVAITGHNEFYHGDYRGTPQELISAIKWGYLYQGQWNERQQRYRGTTAWDIPAARFVTFLQNHDQVANSARGLRAQALTSPGRYRAMTALLMLIPGTPMLFQGQEFAASAPFLYFVDHDFDVAQMVREGRQEFLRQFESLRGPDAELFLIDPCDRRTFELCKLDMSERTSHAEAYALHCDLIRLRREDKVFSAQRGDRIQGAVLGSEAFLLRFFGENGDDRLVLVNLGCDFIWTPIPEPLVAPPLGSDWDILWTSENPLYGGSGTGQLNTKLLRIPGHATLVLKANYELDRA